MIEIIDGQEYKRCSTCGDVKVIVDFYKHKGSRGDGYNYACIECTNKKQRQTRIEKAQTRTKSNKTLLREENNTLANNGTKRCSECLEIKTITSFSKGTRYSDGRIGQCRQCRKKKNAELYRKDSESILDKSRKYYANNKDLVDLRHKRYSMANKEKLNRANRQWYQNNKERLRPIRDEWKNNNIDRMRVYYKAWRRDQYSNNQEYKIKVILRSRISAAIKAKGGRKHYTSMELVGCSPKELRQILESKFKPGMTWDNHGFYGWHIDHIRPCASFDLTDPEQQKQCFHYTNLQPLWAEENLRKGDKYEKTS